MSEDRLDWQAGDIIRETIEFKVGQDDYITNTFLVLDVIADNYFLVHNMEQGMTYGFIPLFESTMYEKVG